MAQLVKTHWAISWEVAGSIPSGVIGFFIDIIFQATLCPLGRLSLWRKWEYFVRVKAVGARSDNFVAFMCRLLENLESSWSPQGLFRPGQGQFNFISIRFLEIIKESELAVVLPYRYNNLHEGQFYLESFGSLTWSFSLCLTNFQWILFLVSPTPSTTWHPIL